MLATLTLALVACAPHVSFQYTVPATYTLPDRIDTVAVVDLPDTSVSDGAADAIVEALSESPRLRVVGATGARQALAGVSAKRGEPLPAETVKRIAQSAKVSGVLALDRVEQAEGLAFDHAVETTTRIERTRPADCPNCKPKETEVQVDQPVVVAHRTVTVNTGWQMYAADGALVTSWTSDASASADGKGDDESEARTNAGSPEALGRDAAEAAGFAAARHVSPWETTATRRYFRCGSSEIRAGHKLARHGDWKGAAKLWREARKTGSARAKARATLNLAVAAEKRGDAARASELASEAARMLDKGWVKKYAKAMKKRKKAAERLAKQIEDADDDADRHQGPPAKGDKK
jgi:hypothetical protein